MSTKLIEKIAAGLIMSPETAEDGVGLELVRQWLQPKLERSAFQALVEQEVEQRRILRIGDKLLLPGTKTEKTITPELAAAESKIMQELSAYWCLDLDELSHDTSIELKLVKSIIQSFSRSGKVVIVSYDFVASQEKINAAHQILADLWNSKRNITPTDFKERIGVTRKYAMALLQYFDDAKITRRLESGRVLLKGPSSAS